MPRFIIKPTREDDLYVEWSTIVDAPIAWGPASIFPESALPADRKERCDAWGTSSWDQFFGWDDKTILVANMGDGDFYELPRENLKPWLEALGDKPDEQDVQQAALDQYATRVKGDE
jgi:hypothetical protein